MPQHHYARTMEKNWGGKSARCKVEKIIKKKASAIVSHSLFERKGKGKKKKKKHAIEIARKKGGGNKEIGLGAFRRLQHHRGKEIGGKRSGVQRDS